MDFPVPRRLVLMTGKNVDPFLLLPQSMARLTLIMRGFKTEAGKNLGNLLEDLYAATGHSFPRLRDVVCVYGLGMPPLGPGRTCVCGRFWHEDYCTFDDSDPLTWAQPFAYSPWMPAERLEALVDGGADDPDELGNKANDSDEIAKDEPEI
ncbi:hypothetical protein Daus18300_005729 [Diaporthe australafricana]|uniref:Uncharacterized protein n=1 Tax=Diaporthe australafricana TaxID=127596 RepID=A0ABR3WYX3_9PEZI